MKYLLPESAGEFYELDINLLLAPKRQGVQNYTDFGLSKLCTIW